MGVLAKENGFQYELVQYKWPRWLNQQTEKQRTMWGYKILFLDVLFPLDVDKIIFVDADQIVRADLKELRDFDLEGNPYGYTPFCDDRKEMDGFRFWKGGYWANHLAGRKYHISAIYVVDLVKFRQIAAGDRLRGQSKLVVSLGQAPIICFHVFLLNFKTRLKVFSRLGTSLHLPHLSCPLPLNLPLHLCLPFLLTHLFSQ